MFEEHNVEVGETWRASSRMIAEVVRKDIEKAQKLYQDLFILDPSSKLVEWLAKIIDAQKQQQQQMMQVQQVQQGQQGQQGMLRVQRGPERPIAHGLVRGIYGWPEEVKIKDRGNNKVPAFLVGRWSSERLAIYSIGDLALVMVAGREVERGFCSNQVVYK